MATTRPSTHPSTHHSIKIENITIRNDPSNHINFVSQGHDHMTAVELRKHILNNMVIRAIESVDITMNTTKLIDETIAKNLGFIPLPMDAPTALMLNVDNNNIRSKAVTSADLFSLEDGSSVTEHQGVVIGHLDPGQSLKLIAYTSANSVDRQRNSKYSAVTACTFMEIKEGGFYWMVEWVGNSTSDEIISMIEGFQNL